MIIPIKNGRTIIPIYIPQSSTNTQNNTPTVASWILLGVVLIFLIIAVVYFIKLLKDIFGGEE